MNVSKCNFCQKSVYPNDSHVNLDSFKYHTGCAKCADCKCQITLANFTKSGDLLLCKTHYFERFSTQGSYAGSEKFKKASTANSAPVVPVNVAPVTSSMTTRNDEPLSEKALSVKDKLKMFGASVNDANKCAICSKSVYPNDPQLALDGLKYHKGCAKCADCQCQINTTNFTRDDKILYCKTHYLKRFKEQGKFVGDDKFVRKRGSTNADHLAGHSSVSSPPDPPSRDDEKAKEEEEEEAARKKAEEEEEAARKKAEEEEEAARKKAEEEEEAARKKAEEEEEEAARKKAEEEEEAARKKAAEEEEEAARKKAAEEEEEAARKKAEEEEEEEAARKKAAEEEEEAARKKTEEEEEAARKKAEEEEEQLKQEEPIDESTKDDIAQNDDEDESV